MPAARVAWNAAIAAGDGHLPGLRSAQPPSGMIGSALQPLDESLAGDDPDARDLGAKPGQIGLVDAHDWCHRERFPMFPLSSPLYP